MSRDPVRLSRRRVLAALGGVGTASAVAGAGTAAYLRDGEGLTSATATGTVGVDVDCDSCSVEPRGVQFAFDGVEPGDERRERFDVRIVEDATPARLWLRTDCPPAVDPLGEALEVRLETAGGSCRAYDSGWTTLDDLRADLAGGLRLDDPDDPCLPPGSECSLRLSSRLPAETTWAVAAESELVFTIYAEQCRHVPESAVDDGPFGRVRCPDRACPACVDLGTLEVGGGRLVAGASYPLDDGDHELQVLSVTDRRDADGRETVCAAFRLLKGGEERDAPSICRVTVGADHPDDASAGSGSSETVHDVEPPSTRTRGELCVPHDGDRSPPEDASDVDSGISTVTVAVCADGEHGRGDGEPAENGETGRQRQADDVGAAAPTEVSE